MPYNFEYFDEIQSVVSVLQVLRSTQIDFGRKFFDGGNHFGNVGNIFTMDSGQ